MPEHQKKAVDWLAAMRAQHVAAVRAGDESVAGPAAQALRLRLSGKDDERR